MLEDTLRSVSPEALSELECSFVAESQRRIRRMRWARRALVLTAVMIVTIAHHLVMRADSKLVAAIDTTGAVTHIWDAASGAPLAELRHEAADFPAITFSADSRCLAASGGDDARVFDTRTWAQAFTVPGPRI